MNSYLTLKTAQNLYDLTNSLDQLYGADILLISRLLTELLQFENKQIGFNLSHKQERDFIKQIVNIASRIMEEENEIALQKVQTIDKEIFVRLLDLFTKYGVTLAKNLADTYTNPFEIVSPNFMFGLDTIEDRRREGNPQSRVQLESETSPRSGVFDPRRHSDRGGVILIPKYNHYMRDPGVWDNTRIHIPQALLSSASQPTVSYSFYRTLPTFLPELYQSDLVARWGSYFAVVSSIVSLSILTDKELEEGQELSTPISLSFTVLYGLATNTNSIHRFIVVCLFTAQLLFIIAAQSHHLIIKADFACKVVAILLHYFWLSVFSWLLVDALHLQRMLTELRDINHGNMKFYVAMGFGIPAVIVGLSA